MGLCGAVQQTDVNTTKMDDVVQSCYHYSPYSDYQSKHSVDQEQQVRQEEETLSGNTIRYFRKNEDGCLYFLYSGKGTFHKFYT